MDEARHLDVFRKRALANGGGLLQGGAGSGALGIGDFIELISILHVTGEGNVQSIFRMGELIGNNEVEKRMFRLSAQDESRHVAFGVMHVKHMLETQPWRHDEVRSYFESRRSPQSGLAVDDTTSEALAILFGKGKKNIDEGYMLLLAARSKQFREITQRLRVCGLSDLADDMDKRRAEFLSGAAFRSVASN